MARAASYSQLPFSDGASVYSHEEVHFQEFLYAGALFLLVLARLLLPQFDDLILSALDVMAAFHSSF
jgi:hypothetical protein